MEGLKQFKEELRNQAINFASVYHVVKDSQTRTEEEKNKLIDEAFTKLEKVVLERFNTWILDSSQKTSQEHKNSGTEIFIEDTTLSLDF